SATGGSAGTAEAGSRAGRGGISTRPAPRCPRDALVLPGRVRRLPVPRLPGPALPVLADGAEPAAVAGAGSGASPQVSQYPPSIVPSQPGRAHLAGLAGTVGAAAAPEGAKARGAPAPGARGAP